MAGIGATETLRLARGNGWNGVRNGRSLREFTALKIRPDLEGNEIAGGRISSREAYARRLARYCPELFLDSPFCAVAAALGWGPHDLFGCDRDRPFARIDQSGLLWLLNGDRLVILAEDAATIETRTGVRQTWRRRPTGSGEVLVWERAP
jgi:hypothetical protein